MESKGPRPTPSPPPVSTPKVDSAPTPLVPESDAPRIAAFTHVHDYLIYARDIGGSDLHINVASPPVIRKYGRLAPLPRTPFTAAETEALLFKILTDEQRRRTQTELALDFRYSITAQGVYRSCIVNQGLVLVTGPNGCGKSTTLAAMVELVNQHRDEHIITIEDPVEFNFVPAKSQINQREVGAHTKSFSQALRAALREDPDVIMIGELRDRETVSLAITAAETGHLVFGTIHTTSAARTIDRILDAFPPDEQPQIRSMISESIRGILCQQLIPRKDGSGRALAMEILLNTPAVSNLIRERKLFQIPSIIQTSRQLGMILLDNSLLDLVNQGAIDGGEAYYAADKKEQFLKWVPRIDGIALEDRKSVV